MRRVRWAQSALDEYQAAIRFLRERREPSIVNMVRDIDQAISNLAARNTARPGRVPGTFEKSIPKWLSMRV